MLHLPTNRNNLNGVRGYPKNLSGLIGWYDGSDFSSITLTGTRVIDFMRDLSGAGNHLVGSGNKALYNSATGSLNNRPAWSYTSNNNVTLSQTITFGAGNEALFGFVGSYNSQFSQSNAHAMGLYNGSGGGVTTMDNNNSFMVGQVGTTTTVQINRNGSLASKVFGLADVPHSCIATIDASGVMTIYIDGVAAVGSTLNANFASGTSLFTLGNVLNDTNRAWHGVMGEAVLANKCPPADSVRALDFYFRSKWGPI